VGDGDNSQRTQPSWQHGIIKHLDQLPIEGGSLEYQIIMTALVGVYLPLRQLIISFATRLLRYDIELSDGELS
jgi:hypothetical protein